MNPESECINYENADERKFIFLRPTHSNVRLIWEGRVWIKIGTGHPITKQRF